MTHTEINGFQQVSSTPEGGHVPSFSSHRFFLMFHVPGPSRFGGFGTPRITSKRLLIDTSWRVLVCIWMILDVFGSHRLAQLRGFTRREKPNEAKGRHWQRLHGLLLINQPTDCFFETPLHMGG